MIAPSNSRNWIPVKAILFTEFEDIEGYVVSASDPIGVMNEQFKDIGYHFLPDKGVCWRLISMSLGNFKMIGVPVHIEDAKYTRRAYVFCICLIVDDNSEAVYLGKISAQVIADVFYTLEIDHSFLSNRNYIDEVTRSLKSLRDSLNSAENHVNLQVYKDARVQFLKPGINESAVSPAKLNIKPYFLPVAIIDPSELGVSASDNHKLIEILNHCDGVLSVSEISNVLRLDYHELCTVLTHMESYTWIALIDQPIDIFTRVRITQNFHAFFDDLSNRHDALAYSLLASIPNLRASETGSGTGTPKALSDQHPSVSNLGDFLVRMYCKLDGHVQDLGEFSSLNSGINISIRHMVIFGIAMKFLRCKTMFPVFAEYESAQVPVLRSCDGRSSWDDIALEHGLSRIELDKLFSLYNVVRIWK